MLSALSGVVLLVVLSVRPSCLAEPYREAPMLRKLVEEGKLPSLAHIIHEAPAKEALAG